MASFLEDITPFYGTGERNGKGQTLWKNFWKNMIHIDIRIRVVQQTQLFFLIKMNRH